MNEKQKDLLADKLADLANYTMTALVLGQVIIRPGRRFVAMAVGLVSAGALYGLSLSWRK